MKLLSKHLVFLIGYIFLDFTICFGQVGIGTVNPTAILEIDSAGSNLPSIEINPQTNPVGSTSGQISLINDRLYMYDPNRSKWLSIESHALQFGYGLSANNQILWFGGDVGHVNSGAKMPYNGTIVAITGVSSGGNSSKRFNLILNGSLVATNANPNLSGRFDFSSGTYSSSTYNVDFNAGDVLSVWASNVGSSIIDPVVILWIKWRI